MKQKRDNTGWQWDTEVILFAHSIKNELCENAHFHQDIKMYFLMWLNIKNNPYIVVFPILVKYFYRLDKNKWYVDSWG